MRPAEQPDAWQLPYSLLETLRRAAADSRTAPRLDTLRACRVLDPEAHLKEVAALLMRALPQMTLQRPVIRQAGASAVSFDERWLLALCEAVATGDHASERFLIARRCHARRAPVLALLIRAFVARVASS